MEKRWAAAAHLAQVATGHVLQHQDGAVLLPAGAVELHDVAVEGDAFQDAHFLHHTPMLILVYTYTNIPTRTVCEIQ